MEERFPYKYAIIRIVPKVEREEFLNVGVILFCKRKKFLGIQFHIDEHKLKAFSSDIDVKLLNDYLSAWKLICEGDKAAGRMGQLEISERFGWLTSCRSSIIQSSITHTGFESDPEKALEEIFRKQVL